MKLYGAIDLHSSNNVMALIDEGNKIVYQKRLPNELAMILKELSVYREQVEGIVVESTYNWYWLVDGLMGEGYRVHLANTAAIQQYEGLKYTDDHSDARWLAHLLRLGVLPEGHIYPSWATDGGVGPAQANDFAKEDRQNRMFLRFSTRFLRSKLAF
jgi:hypothetical protein